MADYSGDTVRLVYAGPGDGEAGPLSKSGIALYVDGDKKDSTVYRVTDRSESKSRDITQHDFRDHEGQDLVLTDATVEVGMGKATSKIVTVVFLKDYADLSWE